MKNAINLQGSNKMLRAIPSFVLLLVFLCLGAGAIRAQIPKELPTSVNTGTVNAGTVLSQFMNGIKPSSFTDSWAGEKAGWLSSVSKITGASGMIGNITSLAKFIKPSMFKSGFSIDNLLQSASKAKSMLDATGLLKNLEGGLKPEAMLSSWAGKRSSWLSALNLLK